LTIINYENFKIKFPFFISASTNYRYLLAKACSGEVLYPGNPINFKSVYFNEGMQYTNGVFLIFDPGYYQVTIHLTPANKETDIDAEILINNLGRHLYGKGTNGGTLNISSIVKLELYDSVNVKIRYGTTTRYHDANQFVIQKISSNY